MKHEFKPLMVAKWILDDDVIIYKGEKIDLSTITKVVVSKPPKSSMSNGTIEVWVGGRYYILAYGFKEKEIGIEAADYISNNYGANAKIKEYRMKCNVCGKIYCYSNADLNRNLANQKAASNASKLSILNALAGTRYDMYEQSKKVDTALAQIVDYSKCPYCNSANITELTGEEYQAMMAATSTANSAADELKKFKELLDSGIITQGEFDIKKKQLLGL